MSSLTTVPLPRPNFRLVDSEAGCGLSAAVDRVASYLVRCGWGQHPARQRADKLVLEVIQRGQMDVQQLDQSAADVSRLVRLTLAEICHNQVRQVAGTVIRPVAHRPMNRPMQLRRVKMLRPRSWFASANPVIS